MNLSHITRFVLLASMAFMGLAHASPAPPPTWINIDISPAGDFVVSFKNQSYDLNISPVPTGDSFFYDGNNPGQSQSPADILTAVESKYNLPSGTLTQAGYCDTPDTTSCTGASLTNFTTQGGDPAVTFAGDPFNYLAIHMGDGELFFAWSLAVDAVTLTGDLSRISNYRSYLDPSVVPLPGAALLFASALGAFGLFGRRRTRIAKATPALI